MSTVPVQPPTPPTFEQRLRLMLVKHEGNEYTMYCDTCPNPVVTTGIGHALFTAQAASALRFVDFKTGNPVSTAQIEAEYHRTLALRLGPTKTPLLILPQSEIDRVYQNDVDGVYKTLRAELSDFDELPDDARLALIDVAFECGSLRDFPRLRLAIETRNWKSAAQNAYRPAAGAGRNKDTQDLLLGLV